MGFASNVVYPGQQAVRKRRRPLLILPPLWNRNSKVCPPPRTRIDLRLHDLRLELKTGNGGRMEKKVDCSTFRLKLRAAIGLHRLKTARRVVVIGGDTPLVTQIADALCSVPR